MANVPAYEDYVRQSPDGMLQEAGEFFMERGNVKLASGMTAAHRLRDLADVQDLIRALRLPADLAERLDPSVRPQYQQLWTQAQTRDRLQEP